MLHIATVHWKSDRWIDIQHRYLEKYIGGDYRVYAALTQIDKTYHSRFYRVFEVEEKSHAVKLNRLAEEILVLDDVDDDDWLMFLDGDAFPIADWNAYADEKLKQYPLLAVQRLENNGDIQPHPCCCLTTVGFWRSIGGDWFRGYQWRDKQGVLVTDVGGNLLGRLREKRVDWYPMQRSNRQNVHPVFFGIYDGIIYHHGAGFRDGASRMFVLQKQQQLWPPALWGRFADWYVRKRAVEESRRMSRQVFSILQEDPDFYRAFL